MPPSRTKAKKAESGLEKAKALFTLRNPEKATEKGWEAYIANRLGANKTADGEDDEYYEEDPSYNTLDAIKWNLKKLEGELALEDGLLQQSFKMLSCDAEYDDEDPRTVTTHTRIYSPTRPAYVDVHFQYHCRSRAYSIEWSYKLGFKVYNKAGSNDYRPTVLHRFERGRFDTAYNSGGWHRIAFGFYDDTDNYGRNWKRIERPDFSLDNAGVLAVYQALWGPLVPLPDDATKKAKVERRRELVNTVRVLLAAVGIKYNIACTEDERDSSDSTWMLEGLSDKWIARGTRKACGFQLKDDAKNEAEGREERLQEIRGHDGDEYDSDEGENSDW